MFLLCPWLGNVLFLPHHVHVIWCHPSQGINVVQPWAVVLIRTFWCRDFIRVHRFELLLSGFSSPHSQFLVRGFEPACFKNLKSVLGAGGQLDQRGAECRWPTDGTFKRSHHSSGRGGSGGRGQVSIAQPPDRSYMSSVASFFRLFLCSFCSLSLFSAVEL